MITVKIAEFAISTLTFFIAYISCVTFVGAFRAWVAKKMGDDTAEYAGLLTLDPLAHIDIVGLIFLFLFYFGWGRYVPINPHNITEPYRRLKMLCAFFSDTFAYFLSALIGIVLLIVSMGPYMLIVAQQMLVNVANMSHLYLLQTQPNLSSLSVNLAFIIIAFIYLNVILGVLNLILNGVSFFMYMLMERSNKFDEYNYYLIMLIPILLIFLFSEPLRIMAIQLISVTGFGISKLFGMV